MKMPEIKKKIIFISNEPMMAPIIYIDLEVPLEKNRVKRKSVIAKVFNERGDQSGDSRWWWMMETKRGECDWMSGR